MLTVGAHEVGEFLIDAYKTYKTNRVSLSVEKMTES